MKKLLLPKNITAYNKTSGPSAESSRNEVERFLAKMGISTYMWNRDDPRNSYLLFKYKSQFSPEPLAYKVGIPFIEKRENRNLKNIIHDERRSWRFFYHIFKNTMLMGEIGMQVEQVFRDFLVIGVHEDGKTPLTLGEKHDQAFGER